MDASWLKQYMPRGLYGRAALILLLPVVAMQLVVAVVFIQRHFNDVTRQMTGTLVQELTLIAAQVEAAPDADSALAQTAEATATLGFDVTLPAEPMRGYLRYFYDLSGKTVFAELRRKLPAVQSVHLTESSRRVAVQMETLHGPMTLRFDRRKVSAANPHQLLVLMLVIGLVMSAIAFIYLRNQLRPITRLATAAEGFGKGRMVPYRPSGALEVRAAGNAFLDMRARIERQTQQRTLMLSGVSHDLRTPLTRLKLGLSMLDGGDTADKAELAHDLEEMEAMLDAFLDFARGEGVGDPEPTNPAELANLAVSKARRIGDVTLHLGAGTEETLVPLRPLAVERALGNLISNALRYAGRAAVTVDLTDRTLRFWVEDDGPGIPADKREEALRPFTRLDEARNQNKGSGVGLGLSIALDVARSHGGMLRLGQSADLGGLKVELVLPR
ncbi:ATP-binding protein [Alphaproteobacteria bacterium KMM 3653]|uniref:histidine kinase n=1 Tax=Harenicola maris TaxID=2841044 RepID=A0AAP2CLL0_9RHOB|nr:ATP-binding protein [Harenicola maris]